MELLAKIVESLRQAFPSAQFGPSASPSSIAALTERVGEIPGELLSFLRLADGIDLHLSDSVVGQIFDVNAMLRVAGFAAQLTNLHLLPIRNDGCGSYDCVDIGVGPTRGAVLFWDHGVWERPAYLLGGTFATYLEMWADHVRAKFGPDGAEDPAYRPKRLDAWPWVGEAERTHPWPFDEHWMRARDQRADELLRDPILRGLLIST